MPSVNDSTRYNRDATGAIAVTAATGVTLSWYRGATGHYTPSVIPYIGQLDFGIGGYPLNADAGAPLPARRVAQRIAAAANGDIIAAHINQPTQPSGDGVVAGVKELQRRGAMFVRFDKLLPNDVATS